VALSTLCSDSFNRADNPLNGSTLDNALGGTESDTWTDVNSTWNVQTNQATNTQAGADRLTIVQSTAAVDIQQVSFITNQADMGVIARWITGGAEGSFYLYYRSFSSVGQLYKYTGSGFTQLGSNGPTTIANGNTMALSCNGTTIQAILNGSVEVSATDSQNATGKPGMYGGGSGLAIADSFKFEIDVAVAVLRQSLQVRQAVNRASTY
jgi:hypothetical protein